MAGVDVTRIADCPVCLARFQDPRVLPCGHTFCLYCIKWHGICKDSDCPVCRARFHIPSNGWEGLPKNYSLNSVLGENAVGTTKSKVTKRSCAKHPNEELVLYCMHCDVVICLDCMEDHWRHDMRSISRFAKQARMTLEDYVMSIQLIWSLVTNQKSEVEEKSKKFCDLLDETELAINEECEKKKRILDDHRRLLLEELSNEKQKVMKDTKMKTDEIEAEQLRLASFKARIEVLLQGSDEARTFDMVSKYKDFKESFDKLKDIQLQASRPTRGIKLIPGDCKELIEKANKIMIGSLQMESDCKYIFVTALLILMTAFCHKLYKILWLHWFCIVYNLQKL